MEEFQIDWRELVRYGMGLQQAREKSGQKEVRDFLRKQGTMLLRETKKTGRASGMDWSGHVKPDKYRGAKHYRDTIKRGRPYQYSGAEAIRVYNYAPHAHLLEYGHRVVSRGGYSTGKRARAFHVFENSRKSAETKFYAACAKWYEEHYKALW